MTRGLPGSGKSWWAKEYQNDNPTYDRVNKDDLRSMLHDGKWSVSNEKVVLKTRDEIIRSSLSSGRSIIVDDTNFEQKHIDAVKKIADEFGVDLTIKDFYTPVEQCIERDAQRAKSVGRDVIMRMYRKYLSMPPIAPEYISHAPDAIICDIDGTIARKGERDIYDGSKAHLDYVIEPVKTVVRHLSEYHEIIMLSGRNEEHRGITESWLKQNNIPFTKLLMRGDGDTRPDHIVKKELYDNNVRGAYNVSFVIDDRKQVKRMWVSEGLFVFDVNQTDEEY